MILEPDTTHISVDLETLSLHHDAVVLSVGIVIWLVGLPEDEWVTWSVEVDWRWDTDGHVDPETVAWWLRQDDTALRSVDPDDELPTPVVAATYLHDFLEPFLEGRRVAWWQRGDIDHNVAEGWMLRHLDSLPDGWDHRTVRDLRTLLDLCPAAAELSRRPEEAAHTALGDALYQARQVETALAELRGLLA